MPRIKRAARCPSSPRPSRARRDGRLDLLIAEATVDAHDDSEQRMGFATMLEENLALPFKTQVLGVEVSIEAIHLTEGGEIVAVCTRGRARQAISLLELPLPVPRPGGTEWIEAYRRWTQGR